MSVVTPQSQIPKTSFSETMPKVILNIPEQQSRTDLLDYFEANGFDVRLTSNASEARKRIPELSPVVSILSVDQHQNESSWLVCKKILMESPAARVLLLGNKPSARRQRKAHFLGAVGYVSVFSTPNVIARTALGMDLPSRN